MRLKWWAVDRSATFRSTAVSVPDPDLLPDTPLPNEASGFAPPSRPVFFGHYWMDGNPHLLKPTVACLDWSVTKDNGHLVAYRYDGGQILEPESLVWA